MFASMAYPKSHDRDLDVVDRRERIEKAVPLFTALPPHPQLTRRCAEVECRCLEPIDVHRVAQDSKVALFLWQPTREPAPRFTAVFAPPHRWCAARAGTCRRRKGHDVYR